MKKYSVFKYLAAGFLMTMTSVSCIEAKTDFNEVGKQMFVMLRNSHYERFTFDEKLGKRFFESYIDHLDPAKQYFLATDVEGFRQKYGENLHQLLLDGNSMQPAKEIYSLYQKRANERIGYAQELLKKEAQFTFEKAKSVLLRRKKAKRPVNEEEAKQLWKDQVAQALLSETLRRENIARLAKKQGKKNPLKGNLTPGKMISLRFERILHGINEVSDESVADQFLTSVAKSYDPHTDYFSKSQMERFMSGMQNSLIGIGALLQVEDDGATKISGIVVGGPADKGGELKLNDRIVGVDTINAGTDEAMEDIMFAKLDHVVDIIRGKAGSEVRLKVEPAGAPGKIKFIVIKRAKVELKDELAKSEVIETIRPNGSKRKLAWITLPAFYADFESWKTRCSTDIKKILLRLQKENVEGVVLDLRGNGGGSLEEVRRMTGFFIGRGPVVQVKNAQGRIEVKDSSYAKPIYDGPLVVMIDKTSASASEILAGALQDYNRAVIVGDTSTFGKGSVQQPMEIRRMMPFMSDGSRAGVLKPTIQKFYRVSGSSTQLKGVESDIVLPSLLDAFEIGEAHLDYAMAHDEIRPALGLKVLNKDRLFLPLLKKKSVVRIAASPDFKYISQDAQRMLERRKKNKLSLNKKKRKLELLDAEQRTNTRNKDRRKRFAQIAEDDKKHFRFFRLNLEDIDKKALEEIDRKKDKESYMQMAKNDVAELDDTPEWPSSLDPVKREGIAILSDLVELTESFPMKEELPDNNDKATEKNVK